MKFSYNWLQSFFTKPLPKPEKLAELLTMHSFEVEEVAKKGSDHIFDIDILPNRATDCLSHYGVSREISALTGVKPNVAARAFGTQRRTSKKTASREPLSLKVNIDEQELCPRYSAYVVEGVKIGESPEWIKDRLAAMEQKAINNVVDITNYVLWELGQPLHAFDFGKIKGGEMTVRASRKGEKLKTLDGATHDLGDETIIIEDAKRIIDLAGIKGGANTQVDDATKKVIFQAAIFDSPRIHQTSKRLGARTDASVRYSHGFDPELPPVALERAVGLLKETNPAAKIVQKIDVYPKSAQPKKVILDVRYANALLGTYLSIREVVQIFERLGFSVMKGKLQTARSELRVTVPTFRLDISIQEDLIEEIGRMYGYEHITPDPPRGILITPRRNEKIFWRTFARQVISSLGFFEVYNYSLIAEAFLLSLDDGGHGRELELQNPVSEEFRYLRSSLLPGILKNVASNARYADAIQIFEIGNVFFPTAEQGVAENENCILAIAGTPGDSYGEGFYRLKGYADEFFEKFGITDFYYDSALDQEEKKHFAYLHGGRCALIVLNGRKIGAIGEVHPYVCTANDLKNRVYCMEVNFDEVRAAAEEEHIYQKPSKYPEMLRDIALLVPEGTMVVEVLNAIHSVSGPLLRDIDLFDMYEGENIPEGMKNFAFHLLFQSEDRTLTAKEVDGVMEKITNVFQEFGWEVR